MFEFIGNFIKIMIVFLQGLKTKTIIFFQILS